MKQNKVIGLTGGSGSGKSTVAAVLKGLGAYVIDCDKIAHRNMQPSGVAYNELVAAFGEGILNPDGEINRKSLGNIVFSNRQQLERLNAITHKHIIERVKQLLAENSSSMVVIDAPLLYEAGLDSLCSEIWVTSAPREVRINRITERDGISRSQAESRINSQGEYPQGHINIVTDFKTLQDMCNYIKGLINC